MSEGPAGSAGSASSAGSGVPAGPVVDERLPLLFAGIVLVELATIIALYWVGAYFAS